MNGKLERPTGIGRQQRVQVGHGPVLPKESVSTIGGGIRLPDDLAQIVLGVGEGVIAAEGAEIGKVAARKDEAMVGSITRETRQTEDLVVVVDRHGGGIRATESAEVDHPSVGKKERMNDEIIDRGFADDDS